MEVAKPGREMELLWVSRQRERGLQHGWVEDTGEGGGKREPSKGQRSRGRTGRCSGGEAFQIHMLPTREGRARVGTAVCYQGSRADKDRQLAGHRLWAEASGRS